MDLAPRRGTPEGSEAAYDRLTGYGFARRYVGGKIVADIDREGSGYGSHLLAQTAESVVALVDHAEDPAPTAHAAPNLSYRTASLPELPFPEGRFDVVVAFGVVDHLERPEDLVREVRRTLKRDGVFVVSALDKRTGAVERGRAGRARMYVPEFRELLERHFGRVRIYRQGTVAGGFVFPVSDKVTGAPVESARFTLADPTPGAEPPTTHSVVAVCADVEPLAREEEPYLLLDRDRGVFDESEERAEDVELLRGEIRQMQETEVQAFRDALRIHRNAAFLLSRYVILLRQVIGATRRRAIRSVRTRGVRGFVASVLRRLFGLLRRAGAKSRDSG